MLLVDGSNLFFRSYYMNNLKLKNQKIGGAYGFIMSLKKLINKLEVKRVLVTWDGGKCRKRLAVYPEYKGNRKDKFTDEEKENISYQIRVTQEILKEIQVRQVTVDGVEADDILAFVSKKSKRKNIIVTNDNDLFQCVSDKTKIYYPKKNKVLNQKDIEDLIGFPIEYFLVYKSIVGDSSDNIKGIQGMGLKRTKDAIIRGISEGNLNINPAWEPIIKRNIYLMHTGLILSEKDKKEIIQKYKVYKSMDLIKLKKILHKYEFKSFLNNFVLFAKTFKKLR